MSLIKSIHKGFIIERKYLFDRLPEKILLVRHGQSEANLNSKVYSTTPNNKISLTEKGEEEAREVAKKIQKIIYPNETLKFYISSYKRALQTFYEIRNELKKKNYIFNYQIEPLLREQEFGMMANITKQKREKRIKVGKYYFRGNGGESGADVNRRVEEFKKKFFDEIEFGNKYYKNIILVTHACFVRVFAFHFLNFSVDAYHRLAKPNNCAVWIFEKNKVFTPMIDKAYKIKNQIEYYKF